MIYNLCALCNVKFLVTKFSIIDWLQNPLRCIHNILYSVSLWTGGLWGLPNGEAYTTIHCRISGLQRGGVYGPIVWHSKEKQTSVYSTGKGFTHFIFICSLKNACCPYSLKFFWTNFHRVNHHFDTCIVNEL